MKLVTSMGVGEIECTPQECRELLDGHEITPHPELEDARGCLKGKGKFGGRKSLADIEVPACERCGKQWTSKRNLWGGKCKGGCKPVSGNADAARTQGVEVTSHEGNTG